jgi:hypothetical protein
MPGKDDVGLRNRGDLCPNLLPELLPPLGEGGALWVGASHPSFDLGADDAVFRRQIRMAQVEFLIDRACDRRQLLLPMPVSFHPSRCRSLAVSMDHRMVDCKVRSRGRLERKLCENDAFEFFDQTRKILVPPNILPTSRPL